MNAQSLTKFLPAPILASMQRTWGSFGSPSALDHRDAGGFFPKNQHPRSSDHLELRQLATEYSLEYVTSPHNHKAFRWIAVRILPPTYGVARNRSGHAAASE